MGYLSDPRLISLLESTSGTGECEIEVNPGLLRLDIREENVRLWQETLAHHDDQANLMLACESNDGPLAETKLTWVVGAAIRFAHANGSDEAASLLMMLGVAHNLTKAAQQHCPGLGEKVIWAFYLERHGRLTATPVKDQID